jgi:hypothetical protein
MPELYETKKGKDIGKHGFDLFREFIYYPCSNCNTPRWIPNTLKYILKYPKCRACSATKYSIDGVTKKGGELGFKDKRRTCLWHKCVGCGKYRWVMMKIGEPVSIICDDCRIMYSIENLHLKTGKDNYNWRDGQYNNKDGYVIVRLEPNDYFYPMATAQGLIFEHRLIMAKHINRLLTNKEVVHHIDENKLNNNILNLQLMTISEHRIYHAKKSRELRKIEITKIKSREDKDGH